MFRKDIHTNTYVMLNLRGDLCLSTLANDVALLPFTVKDFAMLLFKNLISRNSFILGCHVAQSNQ